jgi:outer membrane lipoprotein-sorting protein
MIKKYCGHYKLFLVIALSLLFNSPLVQAVTPEEVLQTVDAIRAPSNNFSFALHVQQDNGKEDEKNFDFTVNVKDNEKSLVTYTAPVLSKGKRLLMIGDNLWIYIPNTRMPIRISPQQKVSAGVSNADIARVVYSLDYQADNLRQEVLDDKNSYHLLLTAKTKGAAYQRIELWTTTDDYRPLKADFYTQSERKLKTIFYKDYQQVLGKSRPMLLEVVDAINSEQRVFMHYSDMQLADTPDIYFQKSYLSRLP